MGIKVDLHLHSSRSFDNPNGPTIAQVIAEASSRGYHGVAITDHDIPLIPARHTEIALAYDIVLLPGVEITCPDGHLLVIGEIKGEILNTSIEAAVQHYSSKDTFLIAAHPFDPKYGMGDLLYNVDIDALELNGRRNSSVNDIARNIARELGLPTTGGSDAHKLSDMGTAYTSVDTNELSIEGIISALNRGNCRGILV